MSTYSEKLKDPRWQKKRLAIFERDGWKCKICKRTKEELHVHHKKYTKGNPWDIDNKHLICICHVCHSMIHDSKLTIPEIKFFYSDKYHKFLGNLYRPIADYDTKNAKNIMVIIIRTLMKFRIK